MDLQTKETGGDIGWQRRGENVPEFDRWLFGSSQNFPLQPGQVSPVFETARGFHILRIDRVQTGESKARQILIVPKIDTADITRTRQLADSVAKMWIMGAQFDTLAKKYHDYGGKEETTILTPFERAKLPPSYQTAFADRKAKEIVVFKIPGAVFAPDIPKFVVAQLQTVDEGGQQTLPEIREWVRSTLSEQGGVRRYIDELKKQTYVSVHDGVQVAAAPKP
jgi:peptidyl-prolyl cis-trans isomerase SurA